MKKIKVLIIVMILYTSSIVLINNQDFLTKASTGDNNKFDVNYIYNVTANLSSIITDPELKHYGLQKGRAFGTPGEHFVANRIIEWMENLSLYDFHKETITDPNDDKLEILGRGLKINGTELVTDFFISPQWNNSWRDHIREIFNKPPLYDIEDLTHNFSYTDLKIYKPQDPQWFYDIFDNQTLIEQILNNESITNISSFLNFLIPIFENKYGFKFEELNETNAPSKIPWYNDTYEPICGSPYVFINETPQFNPNATIPLWKNLTPPWSKIGNYLFQGLKIFQNSLVHSVIFLSK